MYIHKLILILALGEPSFVIFFIHLKCKKNNKCISEQQYISTERRQNPRERSDTMKGNCVCVFVCVCAHAYIRSICLLSHRPVKKDDTKHLSSHVLLTQKLPNGRQEKKEKESPVHSLWKLSPARFSQRTAAQAATCVAFLLSRIVNVPWIIKQSLLQYDTFHLSICVWSPGTSCWHRGQSKLSDSSLHELTSAEESAFISPGFSLYFISYSDTLCSFK